MAGTSSPEAPAPSTSTDSVPQASIEKIQAALDAVDWNAESGAETHNEYIADDATAHSDSTGTEDGGEADDNKAAQGSEGSKPADKAQPGATDGAQAELTLTPLQKQALKHFKFSAEDLADLGQQKAEKLANKYVERFNAESSRWGTVGGELSKARQQRGGNPLQTAGDHAPQQSSQQTPQPNSQRADSFSDEAIQQSLGLPSEEQVLQHFDSEAVEVFHKPMMLLGRKLMELTGQAPKASPAPQQQQQNAPANTAQSNPQPAGMSESDVHAVVNTFFDEMATEGFEGEYGKGVDGWKNVNSRVMRQMVADRASQIAIDAANVGIDLHPREALERAHFIEMNEFIVKQAEQRGREQGIKEQSRKNNMTLTPGGRTVRAPATKQTTEQGAAEKIRAEMQRLNIPELQTGDY